MADRDRELPELQDPDAHLPAPRGDADESLLCIMNGITRTGEWEPADRTRVVAIMGGAKLDFRDAAMLEGTTEVEVLAIMGGVELIVPDDIDLDIQGLPILGGFPHQRHRCGDPDAPTLRVRGLAVMGGVELKIKRA